MRLRLLMICFALIVGGIHIGMFISEKNLNEIREYEYNRGYTEYQIDMYIPAPFLLDEIPVKKPNARLKEKFKG